MGSIVTPAPNVVNGPTTTFGYNIRNNLESSSAPWTRPLSDVKLDIDRAKASGATCVRLGTTPFRVVDSWNGSSWTFTSELETLASHCAYAQSLGMDVFFVMLSQQYDATVSDAEWTTKNAAAAKGIAARLGRYCGRVQVDNEANNIDVRTRAAIDPANKEASHANHIKLAEYVSAVGSAWKQAAPWTEVGTALYGPNPTEWYIPWVEFGDTAERVLDWFGINAYPAMSDDSIVSLGRMADQLAARYSMPVILSETGYTSPDATYLNNLTTGNWPGKLAAEFQKHPSTSLVLWYEIRDYAEAASDWERNFGIYEEDGTAKPYRAGWVQNATTATHRAGCHHGDVIKLVAGASTDSTTCTWRIVSGGGKLFGGGATFVATYLPPAVPTKGTAVLAYSVDGGAERQVTVNLGPHPTWTRAESGLVPTTRGRRFPLAP